MASSSAAVVLRLICRKGFAGSSNYSKISWNRTAGSCSCSFNNGRRQMMSTMTKLQHPSSSSPWLMLPPASDGSFNFYSLADNKVITLSNHEKELIGFTDADVKKMKCRGSSRGWLALLSPHNLDLFLFNPISRCHIKLPPINKLPNFPDDESHSRDVKKVVLSCSPEEENCRAMIIHNNNLLASCCPGRSNEWTPFGGRNWRDEASGKIFARGYYDCAYSAAQKVLFGLTRDGDLETWDLGEVPSSPRLINKVKSKHITSNSIASLRVKYFVGKVEHLVVVEPTDLLLRVTQYVMDSVAPDGSFVPKFDERAENCPHMTIDFDIHKYDPEEGDFKYVHVSSLGGLALFVGIHNQTSAFPAATDDQHYPELKPNSIYFTEPYYRGSLEDDSDDDDDHPYGGEDIGIFNYEDKTVSPCYYPCDVQSLKKILPPPMWFFPSRYI